MDLTGAGFGTAAIHAGQEPDPVYGALATPIYQTSTYCFETVEEGTGKFSKQIPGFVYSRSGNPTTAAFEKKIAFLEGGEAAVATASGMGAIGSVFVAFLKLAITSWLETASTAARRSSCARRLRSSACR